MNYDVAVIGGGPGGYVAAIRAAQLGGRILLIEKEKLGGVCLNRGCIPTKTLLKSAEKWRDLSHCRDFGIQAEKVSFDFAAIMARKEDVVTKLQQGIVKLVASNQIDICYGEACLTGGHTIVVKKDEEAITYEVGKIIVATGSEAAKLPLTGADLPGVLDSDGVLSLTSIPDKLVVIGGGAVGIEFAAIFQTFGCEVTVVERMPAILPGMDSDLAKRLAPLLRKQGIKTLTQAKVQEIKAHGEGLQVIVETKKETLEIAADKVLVAVGRRAVTKGLNLEAAGVSYTEQGITVDAAMETNIPGIYAVGDVIGGYLWAHAASAEGIIAAENAMGKQSRINYEAIPGCIFTTPEIASVGLTEEQAKKQQEIVISRYNFAGNGKAVSMGEADGFVKIIAAASDHQLLGMHIMGPHASDLVMEGALAIRQHLPATAVAETIHPHPTLAETIQECAHGIEGQMIHQLKIL